MISFEQKFGATVIRWRYLLIVGLISSIALVGQGVRHLQFTNEYKVFFSDDNPQLLAFEASENKFTKIENVMIAVTPRDENVFTPRTLQALSKLTERAWQIPYSNRVDSITNFQHTRAEGDDLIVEDLVHDAAQLNTDDCARIRDLALSEPLLLNALISADARVAAVNITVQLPREDVAKESPEVAAYARRLARELEAEYPHLKTHITGIIMMDVAFAESSLRDMQTLIPLSFVLMMALIAIFAGGVLCAFSIAIVILLSTVCGMGVGGYIGYPVTPASSIAPVIILTVSIGNCIHIVTTYLQQLAQGALKLDALRESIAQNLQPIALASTTTAIGFLTFNFSEVPPFQHLGNIVAIGVLTAFILSITLLPAVLASVPITPRIRDSASTTAMNRFAEFVINNRRALLGIMSLLVLALALNIPRNELNDVFVRYFGENITFRTDTDYIVEHLTGLYHIDFVIDAHEAGGISDPNYLHQASDFVAWLRQQPEVVHVASVTDTMKRLNKNMHGDDPSYYRLPTSRELAAQYLLLYEFSLPYGLDLNNQINVDKSSTRIHVAMQTLSSNEAIAFNHRAEAWLAQNAPQIASGVGTGVSLMFANIGKRNIKAMLLGTTVALILVSGIMLIALRSIRVGLISLIPNLVPAVMGFGLWGLLVGQIGLSLSVVAGMTLGIVIDDSVHFLSKYLRARRREGRRSADAIRAAFDAVGRALCVTTFVLVTGFLVLALSSFELNAGMGLLTSVVITFALLADFVLLPPLLMKLEEAADAP